MRKKDIKELDYINLILEASASSCRFGKMTLYDYGGKYATRAIINALLLMPFGAGKTSSLINLGEHAIYVNEFTAPAILGTISREGKFVEGIVSKAGGKILVIDEIQNLRESARKGTLSLLEYPHLYCRSLGYKVQEPVKRSYSKFAYTEARGNTITIKSQFSCIASGMYIRMTNNPLDLAWLSRFIPIKMSITLDYIRKLTSGRKQLRINPRPVEMDFLFRRYKQFHKEYFNIVENLPFFNYFTKYDRLGFIARNVADMARLSCFFASLENRKSPKRKDWEQSFRFIPVSLYNYLTIWLDDTAYVILHYYDKKTKREIAEMTGTSESNISHRIKDMRKKGLLPIEEIF